MGSGQSANLFGFKQLNRINKIFPYQKDSAKFQNNYLDYNYQKENSKREGQKPG